MPHGLLRGRRATASTSESARVDVGERRLGHQLLVRPGPVEAPGQEQHAALGVSRPRFAQLPIRLQARLRMSARARPGGQRWIVERACKDRLRTAQAAGQLLADIDLDIAVDLFYGGFYHRYLLRIAPLSHEHADAIVDATLPRDRPPRQGHTRRCPSPPSTQDT